jgi:hypothetical protein
VPNVDWYNVLIERRGDDPAAVTQDAMFAFHDALVEHSGQVTGGPGYVSYGARLSVEADSPIKAAMEALVYVRCAALDAGLPNWPAVRTESVREDVFEQDDGSLPRPDLVSGPEAAKMLGVSVQRVHQLAAQHPDFPKSAYKYDRVTLWHRAAIEKFNSEWTRKPGRPRKVA